MILVCTHTEKLRASRRDPRVHGAGSRGHVQPPSKDAKTMPGWDPADPPPAVVVTCHADSMELLVQADLFHRGLQVDARHLRLGPRVRGDSACVATPSGEAQFTIWAPLTDCGLTRSVSSDLWGWGAGWGAGWDAGWGAG